MEIPYDTQLRCAQRELRLRHGVYPGLVARGKMTREQARQELAAMGAIVETLRSLAEHESPQQSLWEPPPAERLMGG